MESRKTTKGIPDIEIHHNGKLILAECTTQKGSEIQVLKKVGKKDLQALLEFELFSNRNRGIGLMLLIDLKEGKEKELEQLCESRGYKLKLMDLVLSEEC